MFAAPASGQAPIKPENYAGSCSTFSFENNPSGTKKQDWGVLQFLKGHLVGYFE